MPIRHAIILSAGQGSRLLPVTENLPKCLIPFSGKSLILLVGGGGHEWNSCNLGLPPPAGGGSGQSGQANTAPGPVAGPPEEAA